MTDSPSSPSSPSPSSLPPEALAEFARAFGQLAQDVHQLVPGSAALADRVQAHLGSDPATATSVGQVLPAVERPNLQLALDELLARSPGGTVFGLSPEIVHYGNFSFSALLTGRFHGPSEPVSPVYEEVPVDIDATLRCVTAGLWLVQHEGVPVVIGVVPGEQYQPGPRPIRLESVAADPDVAQAVVDRLAELRRNRNVYRRKVLSFSHSEYGEFGINFMRRPATTAGEVILPPADLTAIEQHVIGLARRSSELLAAGQHLKRGLLLYGPPGTGKSHTIGYLMAAMPERTVVVLQGPSVGALGQAAAIVRALTPSMLVIEDVDLIAAERGMYGTEPTPLLFQLLNEMDGLTPTDDVCFVLTTNRAEILEPALVARPGRIDQAVEIGLPDEAAREQLLRLYLDRTPHSVTDLAPVVQRTEGVTASFMKELVRRAAFAAINEADGRAPAVVEARHVDAALDDLLERALPIVRTILGGTRPDEDPAQD